MKKYLKSPLFQIVVILLILVLICEIAFLLIDKDFQKFIEMTYQAIIATVSIVGAFMVSHEIETNKHLENVKKSEILIMRLLEDELKLNIDIYNNQYRAESKKNESLNTENKEQFIVDKWASIQISLIQIRDLFYDKDLYSEILMLYSNFNRINYLIRNKRILEAHEKKILFSDIERLIWKVFIETREYNKELYLVKRQEGVTPQVNVQDNS